MPSFITKSITFFKGLYKDPEIPKRDKIIFGVCLMLIISPIDVLPDFIPVIGVIDDFILIATLLDYVFDVLDQRILLKHFPWSEKSFARIKKWSRVISKFAPDSLKHNIWDKAGRIADEKMAKTGEEENIIIDIETNDKKDASQNNGEKK